MFIKNSRTLLCILFIGITIFITSCNDNKVQNVDLTDRRNLLTPEYTENNELAKQISVGKITIKVPDKQNCETYCVYDSILYYVVMYYGAGDGTTSYVPEENGYKIIAFDMKDGTASTIYENKESMFVSIDNLQCNGQYLVWSQEDSSTGRSNIKIMNISDTTDIRTLFDEDRNYGEMFDTALTEAGLFWLEMNEFDDFNYITSYDLCRYSFETDRIETLISDIKTDSLSDGLFVFHNQYLIKGSGFNGSTLLSGDIYSKYQMIIHVRPYMDRPKCNNRFCIWNDSTGSNYYIYNLVNKKFEYIEAEELGEYGIVGDYVIVQKKGGIYCYDVEAKQYCKIMNTDDLGTYTFFQGVNNDIYGNYRKYDITEELESSTFSYTSDSNILNIFTIKQN